MLILFLIIVYLLVVNYGARTTKPTMQPQPPVAFTNETKTEIGAMTTAAENVIVVMTMTEGNISDNDGEEGEDVLKQSRQMLIIFRSLGCVFLMLWLWGADLYVWTKKRVNYVFIFEMNSRRHVRFQHVFDIAAALSTAFTFCLFFYFLVGGVPVPNFKFLSSVPVSIIPALLYIVCILLSLFICFKTCKDCD